MADAKISALSAASALAGTEVAPVVQSLSTVKATINQIRDYVAGALGETVITSAGLTFTGNISRAAWTTDGARIKAVTATLTDTSSTGTISAAYTNVLGGNTIAASSATTFTTYATLSVTAATAGTNVTFSENLAAIFTGAVRISGALTMASAVSAPDFVASAAGFFYWTTRSEISSPVNGNIMIRNAAGTDFGRLQFGGSTSSFPSLKRSTTVLQSRLADDSAFAPLQGMLRTDVAAVTGLTAGVLSALTDASIVIYDSGGQAYRIPCII